MNLDEYQEKLKLSTQNSSIGEHIYEMCELFNDLANTKILSYYKYEYEYNDFFHQFTLNENGIKIEKPKIDTKQYKILLRDKKIVFGYFLINKRIKSNPILQKLLKKIIKYLEKEKYIQKKLFENDMPFNIYLIHDEDLEMFSQNLKGGLEGLFNSEVTCDKSIEKYLDVFKSKEKKHIIIFLLDDYNSTFAHKT